MIDLEQRKDVRTWIEIDDQALKSNMSAFRSLISPGVKFMAVVKSNAYGHGLSLIAKQLSELRIKNKELRIHNSKFIIHNSWLWFGVDSIVEALRLREEGIKNPILVLGYTLPSRLSEATEKNIILTISNFEALSTLAKIKNPPAFHIKIDTGMYRQGFLLGDVARLARIIRNSKLCN